MSSFIKANVKLSRESLAKKDYKAAQKAATEVLSYEPKHYNANVFLGLALLELEQSELSEKAFQTAAETDPDQILAWQGFSKLYERTQRWEDYASQLNNLCCRFQKLNDPVKCAETLQKFIGLRREKGTRSQLIEALSLLLPTSDLYHLLSGLPEPEPSAPTSTSTYQIQVALHNPWTILEEIVDLTEKEENEFIQREVEKRRTRLGAPTLEVLKKEIIVEVLTTSKLPYLYEEILIDPHTSDDLRRSTESKLLRHKRRHLHAIPRIDERKPKLAAEVLEMAKGAVLLGIPDELAWIILIESTDTEQFADYDLATLRRFIEVFRGSPMASLILAYFRYKGIPPEDGDDITDDLMAHDAIAGDLIDAVIDAFSGTSGSIFAHRMLVDVYAEELDYESSISVSEAGLKLLEQVEMESGISLPRSRKAFLAFLAVGLVNHYPPKYHARAIQVLDEVLALDPDNIPCLIGRAHVFQYAKQWMEAHKIFARVGKLAVGNLDIDLTVREEVAWCLCQVGKPAEAETALRVVIDRLDPLDGKGEQKARAWWKLGKSLWDQGGSGKREAAYAAYITSLKRLPTFASSFTGLGIYYLEYSSPPDPLRASKCFQKAFELDAREGDAARRLAEGFATENEWDLVEIVARRTIEAEGGLANDEGASREQIAGARYLPNSSWAWKALGLVKLNGKDFAQAAQAFQVTLRAEPDDFQCWLNLGEAYTNLGRHVAALKAFTYAHQLQPDDWVCLYHTAEVQKQIGNYQTALDILQTILIKQPNETGVIISLAETYLYLGRTEACTGFRNRCEQSFGSAINTSRSVIMDHPGFRRIAWKIISDALLELSEIALFFGEGAICIELFAVANMLSETSYRFAEDIGELISLSQLVSQLHHWHQQHIEGSEQDSLDFRPNGLTALELATLACDYRRSLAAHDIDVVGSCSFDLAVSLHRLSKHLTSESPKTICIRVANRAIKQALLADPGNSVYWNALGTLSFEPNPKLAQHTYIKALELDPKGAPLWASLGFLYLHHEDTDLAAQAFLRAQALDSDQALPLVGQALLLAQAGRNDECRGLLEHTVSLSHDPPEVNLEFARLAFAEAVAQQSIFSSNTLFAPFFALDRYCQQNRQDSSALHLFGLVCERLGHTQLSVDVFSRTIGLLEAAYEKEEDSEIERRFAIAKTNLGRLLLNVRDYQGSLEALEVALSLLPADDLDPLVTKLRTQAQFLSGLANFKSGNLEAALITFEAAFAELHVDLPDVKGHVTILLAQTLWALGTEVAQEEAKSQLLKCIGDNPENLGAITTLAAMGILTADDGLLDAALSDILALSSDRRLDLDPIREVVDLLIYHNLGQGRFKAALEVAQKAVHAEPLASAPRQHLASLLLHQGTADAARSVLSGSLQSQQLDGRHRRLTALSLALSLKKFGPNARESSIKCQKMAEKAVVEAPWDQENWAVLGYVRSIVAS